MCNDKEEKVLCLFSEKPEDEGKEKREQNTCGEGEIEGKVFSFHSDVARETSNPWDFVSQCQQNTYACYEKADCNKRSP